MAESLSFAEPSPFSCDCGRKIFAVQEVRERFYVIHGGPGSQGRPYRCEIDVSRYIDLCNLFVLKYRRLAQSARATVRRGRMIAQMNVASSPEDSHG